MSDRHKQRLLVVFAVLLIALGVLFSPVLYKLFHPNEPMNGMLNLRPGIDMVGGTSLVYSIKPPAGGYISRNGDSLSVAMMEALKRRIDPSGVKNLIWRPQGDDRLEIQLPGTGQTNQQRTDLEQQLSQAQDALDATNIRPQEVIDAVEKHTGKDREKLLAALERGSPQRHDLFFNQLVPIWDALQSAKQHHNLAEQARKGEQFQNLTELAAGKRNAIEDTNLSIQDLNAALDSGAASPAMTGLKSKFAGWKQRLDAIDQYASVYESLSKIKGSIGTSNELKRELQGAGVLEFHVLVRNDDVARGEVTEKEIDQYRQRLETLGPALQAGDTLRWYEATHPNSVYGIQGTYNGKTYFLAYLTPERSLDQRAGTPAWHLTSASPGSDQLGATVVDFNFDPQGGALFGKLTKNNIGRPMAIMLDNKIISAPTIQSQIGESGQIDGGPDGFSHDELTYLVETLTAGSLPAELSDQPISEQTVSPTIGSDNLRYGLWACGLGLIVVGIFLVGYYYIAGVVAYFAVVMNVLLILAVMACLQATFTLPSIAGIVLTIGTAVDANVLIFERLREEQHRGLSLRMALRNAYAKALSAIVDSNMTTIITSVFLIWFGTEEVKGFGITLIIGIVASLFTALFVTRTIFEIFIDDLGLKNLSSLPLTFPKWDRMLRPNIDWMRFAPVFISFSVLGIGAGLVLFSHYAAKKQVLSIDFTSGTSVQFQLKEHHPMPLPAVRKYLDKANPSDLPDYSLVSIGSDGLNYEVDTPNPNSVQVKNAVIKALADEHGQSLLQVEVPSTFVGAGEKIEKSVNKQVIPITAGTFLNTDLKSLPFTPKGLNDFSPGVAIYLDHLDPPLSVTQIKQRIINEQQSESAATAGSAASQEFAVVGANGASTGGGPAGSAQTGSIAAPVTSAVVLASQSGLDYSKDAGNWQVQLAEPMWKLVNNAINSPAQLQKVNNFDAAVAGDTKTNAFLALTLSIIVIMIYIWVRFGNLTYGTATVIALLHDTVFTIAALGFAHLLSQTWFFAHYLQIEPFRIDLTVVAGILTIMGYSMIDTIVVFDRIRENRGKFGHVNRQVINDAINQTLSRTLLTAGTTTITVAIMYFVGGPGIHGFTFVLLIGILVGTYSSIAIAAPFLLIGGKGGDKGQEAQPQQANQLPAKPLQGATAK